MSKKTCFVVQGFGEKTDFQTGRVLNLDASYDVIKEAVETAGFECIRADEIPHSGQIEKPMYEQLLEADVVIADLSTSNVNAAYELGVRHALRPNTTIIVAEQQFAYPFDVGHIAIRSYEHLGSDLGRREANRFAKDLGEAIEKIVEAGETDSPVYTFLPGLQPPGRSVAATRDGVGAGGGAGGDAAGADADGAEGPAAQSLRVLTDQARQLTRQGDFVAAKGVLLGLRALRPHDDSIVQQLALVTYKGEQPDRETALDEARRTLAGLEPAISHDPETLGLWGAIHKRLWELRQDRADLDAAVRAYERGFQLRGDHYNGINLAYLLNVRAAGAEPADAIADFVLARRVRDSVIGICERLLDAAPETPDDRYWILATLWEASLGRGDEAGAREWEAQTRAGASAPWMIESTQTQIAKLEALLEESPLRLIAGSATTPGLTRRPPSMP